jgi:hypothetical protein
MANAAEAQSHTNARQDATRIALFLVIASGVRSHPLRCRYFVRDLEQVLPARNMALVLFIITVYCLFISAGFRGMQSEIVLPQVIEIQAYLWLRIDLSLIAVLLTCKLNAFALVQVCNRSQTIGISNHLSRRAGKPAAQSGRIWWINHGLSSDRQLGIFP